MEYEKSESGAPIIRHTEVKKEWTPPEYGEEEHLQKIEEHVEHYFGEIETVFHELVSDTIHVDVLYVKPGEGRPFHTFVTMGMSILPMTPMEEIEGGPFAELMICLPENWKVGQEEFNDYNNYWPIRWLKMLARFPHDHNTWLGFGHTMPNGDPAEPFADNTKMSTMLLLPPIGVDKGFWELPINDDRTIKFYNLVPLYEEETQHKLKYGAEGLFDKFDDYEVGLVLNPNRPNTCKKKKWFWKSK